MALSTVLKEYEKIGFNTRDSKIIDISKVEVINIFIIYPVPDIIYNG